MIVIIEYGVGNVSSIQNMFKKIGVPAVISGDKSEIEQAESLVLPGVGSFDAAMQKLAKCGLVDIIIDHALERKKPLLGICLGMQMLGRGSEEGIEKGLELIPFDNKRFDFNGDQSLKVPHMGWDRVGISIQNDPFVQGLDPNQRYYFVHSYHAVCDKEENILMSCDYGYPFTAAVKKENIYGVQFHPEKSHRFGMALLENFARRV